VAQASYAPQELWVPLDKSEGSVKGKIILCGAQAPLGLPGAPDKLQLVWDVDARIPHERSARAGHPGVPGPPALWGRTGPRQAALVWGTQPIVWATRRSRSR